LLNSKPTPYDQNHNVRIAFGNGMRQEAWVPYQKRFKIPEIGEFYGATEGNQSFINHTKTADFINFPGAGACGYISPIFKLALGEVVLIEHDPVTELPVRNKDGLCIQCPRNKPGELVGLIPAKKTFQAYTDSAATEKKILRNVLKKGDQYFRTGDLLRLDENDYLWFVDRVGDTFRWKGENVSTGEVSACISDVAKITEANVYGVKIPGSEDGRACMVAITTEDGKEPNLATFLNHVDSNLATYQRPMFIRLLPSMQSTGTFKQRKVDFVKDGFDPKIVNDKLWWYNPETKSYEELNNHAYNVIVHGKARL
jgi:fatty-acyl-CoA synthase